MFVTKKFNNNNCVRAYVFACWRLVTEVMKVMRALAVCSRQVMLLPCVGCSHPPSHSLAAH